MRVDPRDEDLERPNGKNALPRTASRPKLLSQYLFLGALRTTCRCFDRLGGRYVSTRNWGHQMPHHPPPMTKEPSVHRALPCQRVLQPGLALLLLLVLQPGGISVTRRPSP